MHLSSDLSNASPHTVYKRSSEYFLTKHFPEAAAAIAPLLKSQERKWQQRAWGLYIVTLDHGLKLSDQQGKRIWGQEVWEGHVMRVREGRIWDELLRAVDGDRSEIETDVLIAMYIAPPWFQYGGRGSFD